MKANSEMLLITVTIFALTLYGTIAQVCDDNVNGLKRCGWLNMTEQDCHNYNCCWGERWIVPSCYHKIFVPAVYTVSSKVTTTNGLILSLITSNTVPGKYGPPINPLRVEIYFETSDRLRVKILDPNSNRWEIPSNIVPSPDPPANKPLLTNYNIQTADIQGVFWFAVERAEDKEVVFNSSTGSSLTFYDQYIVVGTQLPKGFNIYGLGEQVRGFRINASDQYTLWNYDIPTPYHKNLYGSHPFYLEHRVHSGKSHGVFLRNSNGMDINTTESSIIYQIIGGIIDLYFFMGPHPETVISQYLDLIGRPAIPPYWSLGFHQCRWGYSKVQELEEVVANYSKANIPLETIWSDIDYMDEYKDFTFDPKNFPVDKMQTFVKDLHTNNQHYVVIVDPGIAKDKNYTPYTDGLEKDLFVKNRKGEPFTGKVWPGLTVYPDFLNPNTQTWWEDQFRKFLQLVAIDGIWVDMNEASNFCNGECGSKNTPAVEFALSLDSEYQSKTLQFDPNNPPYAINNQNTNNPLNTKTLDMDAYHHGRDSNILVYNAHNLYGLTECIATREALLSVQPNQRPFILSRSTFPSSGVHAAHWTGDNHATWFDMYLSIPDILNFQLFGVPFVGSDICGFNGDTTEELCGRWMALGAFYPFSRNHNIKTSDVPQEAYRWDSVASISREMLTIRYRLLPYLYTQFVLTNKGSKLPSHEIATVVKPLFFQFPRDEYSLFVDRQFFFGPALMVSQVFESNTEQLTVYFPPGQWYDWFSQEIIISTDKGVNKTLPTPKDKIQLHVLGGNIMSMQSPGVTTTECRKGFFSLLVALDSKQNANGILYLDDGITVDTGNYIFIEYSAKRDRVTGILDVTAIVRKGTDKHLDLQTPDLDAVNILGITKSPTKIVLNGDTLRNNSYSFWHDSLKINELKIKMEEEWKMEISL